jgi:hypothetical protein
MPPGWHVSGASTPSMRNVTVSDCPERTSNTVSPSITQLTHAGQVVAAWPKEAIPKKPQITPH